MADHALCDMALRAHMSQTASVNEVFGTWQEFGAAFDEIHPWRRVMLWCDAGAERSVESGPG